MARRSKRTRRSVNGQSRQSRLAFDLLQLLHMPASDAADLAKRIVDTEKDGSHKEVDKILDDANLLLKGYGVEALTGRWNTYDRYYANIQILYVNLGDTYKTTLLYDAEKDKFSIGAWGDIVETQPKRFDQ